MPPLPKSDSPLCVGNSDCCQWRQKGKKDALNSTLFGFLSDVKWMKIPVTDASHLTLVQLCVFYFMSLSWDVHSQICLRLIGSNLLLVICLR